MKLPFSILPWRQNKEDLYLGIFLKESEGIVFYLQPNPEGLRIVQTERFQFSNGWENLIDDVDDVLYRLEASTKKSPSQTILFLFSHFIDLDAKEIKQPYLSKIKEMAKSLELKPLGYIECHEAILDYLQKKEQHQLTAILLEFDRLTVGVFVYQGGKLLHQEYAARSSNIIEVLIPLFEKVREQMVLPSRIIMYNSKDLDVETGALIGHKWDEDFFVQPPKIEIVQEADLIRNLVQIFSQQINIEPNEKTVEEPVVSDSLQTEEIEDFDDDVIPAGHEEKMGFVIGGDAPEKIPVEREYTEEEPQQQRLSFAFLTPLIQWVRALPTTVKRMSVFQTRSRAFTFLSIVGAVLIICGVVLSEYFFHTASVTVMLPSQALAQLLEVESSDLKIQSGTETMSFTASQATTGTREVGERAKGGLTIYNSSLSSSKTFPKGTVIKASNGLEFVLDGEVKVASASGDASAITSSTAKGAITARAIGPESNLAAGTKFSVADESSASVLGKNDSALSGGTKREIQTVAKEDVVALQKSISTQASAFTKAKINKKLEKGSSLLSQLTTVKNVSTDLSAEEGEEADTVSLKSGVQITHYFYKDSQLKKLIAQEFQKRAKKGYVLSEDNIAYTVRSVKKDGDNFVINLDARAKAAPPVSINEIRDQIVGKSSADLEKIMREKFAATGIEFVVKHPIGFLEFWLPLIKQNIRVSVVYP